ncbi:glycosyltransferase family 4 protein [Paenibacillus popilliae]|uniref:Glycosyltransferase family 1 protein n=1 Tax=Paenibacillus popilliae TaxID=78057 RepID=A0ABY3AMD2_PAEPP|nr:glycosyltransferase family 1 protein [Paenibacillus sp. SDF0028]TQR43697.1 glycosyltransferase family 1 protein [Paenibacillus sp. SDF0028]
MKILMDGVSLLSYKTGVGYYTSNLFKYLNLLYSDDIKLICNGLRPPWKIKLNDSTLYKIPYPFEKLKKVNQDKLFSLGKLEYFCGNFDIYHGTNFSLLPTRKAKRVVTIHDLSFLKFPDLLSKSIVEHHTKWALRSIREADAIITVSKSVKQELVEMLNVAPELIEYTHLAASERFIRRNDDEKFKYLQLKYSLPGSFLLFVGTLEYRKNIKRLIQAYELAKREYGLKEEFVLIGKDGIGCEEIHQLIDKYGLSDSVRIMGYVDGEDLPYIYNMATALMYASLYEGFGLPIIEAMQSGLPVITSNLSSMPEVAGHGAILVNPYDVDEIAYSMFEICSNKVLRQKIIAQGLLQSSQFNWTATASNTMNIYRKLYE